MKLMILYVSQYTHVIRYMYLDTIFNNTVVTRLVLICLSNNIGQLEYNLFIIKHLWQTKQFHCFKTTEKIYRNVDLMQKFGRVEWQLLKSSRWLYCVILPVKESFCSRILILWLILYTIFTTLICVWWRFKWEINLVMHSIIITLPTGYQLYHVFNNQRLHFHFQRKEECTTKMFVYQLEQFNYF